MLSFDVGVPESVLSWPSRRSSSATRSSSRRYRSSAASSSARSTAFSASFASITARSRASSSRCSPAPAGVARLVLATQPGQAGPALSAIETASRSALDELRKLLRQIRDPEDADEAAAPTLSDLPTLIDKLRRAGLDVSCHSTGQPSPYGTAVELSAYRIVQEALTNVTKHAIGARTRVEIDHGADELTLTVTDDGRSNPARSAASGGLGIPGMRERAGLLGGTLTAGPRPGGGFIVTARLPARKGRESVPAENRRYGLTGQESQEGLN